MLNKIYRALRFFDLFILSSMDEWMNERTRARASEYELEPNFISISFHFSSFSLFFVSHFFVPFCSIWDVVHRDAHSFTYVTFYYISFIFVPLGLDEIVVAWAPSLKLDLFFVHVSRYRSRFHFSLSLFLSLPFTRPRVCVRVWVFFCLFMVSSCSRVQTKIQSWHWLIQFVS